ncbi:hypothetical protein VULLAG_LOCUS5529 [Vulpes lagopus]
MPPPSPAARREHVGKDSLPFPTSQALFGAGREGTPVGDALPRPRRPLPAEPRPPPGPGPGRCAVGGAQGGGEAGERAYRVTAVKFTSGPWTVRGPARPGGSRPRQAATRVPAAPGASGRRRHPGLATPTFRRWRSWKFPGFAGAGLGFSSDV